MALRLCRDKVHHHLEPVSRCKLTRFVKQYGNTQCSDVRDKVFALPALHRCDLPRHPEVCSMSVMELLLLASRT